jgi:hypothetical protein
MNPLRKFRARPSWNPRTRFAPKAKPRPTRGTIKRRKGILCENATAKGRPIRGTSLGKIREIAAAGKRHTKTSRRVNRLPEWTDKRSYITKGLRHRLFGKDYTNLSALACLRTIQRYGVPTCECGCGRTAWSDDITPLKARGELAHKKHGARKSDELDQVDWMRHECHMKSHNCGGKPIKVTKKSLKEKTDAA